ncbi:hypothetical protein B9Q30_16720 [Enterobacter hormaechei]|uniref:IS1 family transposase n=1 Tax=Enterobacter hormaechei TaxID=158836 RepID=A0A2J0PZZ0_9ENTR|nr:hypothetical protein B9Q30_16720 [Enterobacter hormaechei]
MTHFFHFLNFGRDSKNRCAEAARYQQSVYAAHNLNLRQHLARLGRKSLSFSKSVELHDKVIGHYLTINHYP